MHRNWNGYLVKALNQLEALYHVCKSPRLTKATARAITGQAHRKLPFAKSKRECKRLYEVLILVLGAIILKKIT